MKKLVTLPFVLLAITSFSQISLGLKAGVNISNFTGGDFNTIEKDALVGFHGGGLVHISLGHLVVQPEVLFSSQGAKLTSNGTESDFKLSYITIPAMVKWETDGGFYLEAGPQGGFKISENVPDSITSDFVKGGDFSFNAGLGFHSSGGFGIGARYNVGISKIGEFDSDNINPDFKNSVLQFSIFYTFLGKKKKG
jgi:PPE-repeat protein